MIRLFAQFRTLLPFGTATFLLLLSLWLLVFPEFPLMRLQMDGLREENEALNREILKTAAYNESTFDKLAGYRSLRDGAMRQMEQTATVLFRERIESAAAAAGLHGRTIGNVRCVTVESDVLMFDVPFSAEGSLAEVVDFLKSMETESPRLYWRNLSIQPGKGAFLTISGTLSALSMPEAGTPAGKELER